MDGVLLLYSQARILAVFGRVLFVDKSWDNIRFFILPLLCYFGETCSFSLGSAVIKSLYRELSRATVVATNQIPSPLSAMGITSSWYIVNLG